jgi:hypothetical protein
LFCNGPDTCSGGSCSVHTGKACPGADGDSNCSESCKESTDTCNAPDPNGSSCNDGVFCNGADTCSSGSCSQHAGSPCTGQQVCNEAQDKCETAGCPSGNSCNDGIFCNGSDTCFGNSCSVHAGSPCSSSQTCNESTDTCVNTGGTPPSAPKKLKESSQCKDGCINLAWKDTAFNETGFEIGRTAGEVPSGQDPTVVAQPGTNATTYQQCNVNGPFLYRVRAKNGSGTSAWSNQCATCEPQLAKPANLSLSKVSGGVRVNWTYSDTRQRGFQVQRRVEGASSWTTIANSLGKDVRTFTDSFPSNGDQNSYRVRAQPVKNQCRKPSKWATGQIFVP